MLAFPSDIHFHFKQWTFYSQQRRKRSSLSHSGGCEEPAESDVREAKEVGVKRLQFNVNSEHIALRCQENSDVSDGQKSEEVGVKRLQFKLPRAIKG